VGGGRRGCGGWGEEGREGSDGGEGEKGEEGEFGVGVGFVEWMPCPSLATLRSHFPFQLRGDDLGRGNEEYIPKNLGELLETELGLVGVFRISVCGEGIQGCAVTKYTSCVKETLTSFFSSPSATDVNLIIAE
jgi:hypothetical protein